MVWPGIPNGNFTDLHISDPAGRYLRSAHAMSSTSPPPHAQLAHCDVTSSCAVLVPTATFRWMNRSHPTLLRLAPARSTESSACVKALQGAGDGTVQQAMMHGVRRCSRALYDSSTLLLRAHIGIGRIRNFALFPSRSPTADERWSHRVWNIGLVA